MKIEFDEAVKGITHIYAGISTDILCEFVRFFIAGCNGKIQRTAVFYERLPAR